MKNYQSIFRSAAALLVILFAGSVLAALADNIDSESNKALEVFRDKVKGADVFLDQAAGYLIFPRVIKVGIGIGVETGEGVLRVGDSSVDRCAADRVGGGESELSSVNYYRTPSGSIGLQLGAQAKSMVIVFMTQDALKQFRDSRGWKVGVDGSVALIDMGKGKTLDSHNIKDPVVGFIYGSKGMMLNLTLEGSKFSKLDKF